MMDFLYPSALPRLAVRFAAALIAGVCAFLVANRKNRIAGSWAAVCAVAGFTFYPVGVVLFVILVLRPRLSARIKYLSLGMEERFCLNMGIPSPLGDDLEKKILVVLARNPRGLRIGAIGQGAGVGWRSLEAPMENLLRAGKVLRRDDTYYFNLE